MSTNVKVIALDIEGTLISNAYHCEARPGLYGFARFCLERFERIAIFTAVPEDTALEVLERLVDGGHLPPEFLHRWKYIDWIGVKKDLIFIENAEPGEILIVDDDEHRIVNSQKDRWIPVTPYYGGDEDAEPGRVMERIEKMI